MQAFCSLLERGNVLTQVLSSLEAYHQSNWVSKVESKRDLANSSGCQN